MTRLLMDTVAANVKTRMHVNMSGNQRVHGYTGESAVTTVGLFRNYANVEAVDSSEACQVLLNASRIMSLELEAQDCLALLGDRDKFISIAMLKQIVATLEIFEDLPINRRSQLASILHQGHLTEKDVESLMPNLNARMGISSSNTCYKKMMLAYVGVTGGSVVSASDFCLKFGKLATCVDAMMGELSIEQLFIILHQAFLHFDENDDGAISLEEFLEVMQHFNLPFDESQVPVLHDYLDIDKDGLIRNNSHEELSWSTALCEAVTSQVARKGLVEVGYAADKINEILCAEEVLETRVEKALSCTSDIASIAATTAGLMQQASSMTSPGEIDAMDIAPLFIFLGISALELLHNFAVSQACNMTHREALLYARTFQKEGFTVPEFKKVMSYCKVSWQSYSTGAVISPGNTPQLRTIVQGACHSLGKKEKSFEAGFMFGCEQLLAIADNADQSSFMVASRPTDIVTLDINSLNMFLEHDDRLKNKVHGMVTSALVDELVQ